MCFHCFVLSPTDKHTNTVLIQRLLAQRDSDVQKTAHTQKIDKRTSERLNESRVNSHANQFCSLSMILINLHINNKSRFKRRRRQQQTNNKSSCATFAVSWLCVCCLLIGAVNTHTVRKEALFCVLCTQRIIKHTHAHFIHRLVSARDIKQFAAPAFCSFSFSLLRVFVSFKYRCYNSLSCSQQSS